MEDGGLGQFHGGHVLLVGIALDLVGGRPGVGGSRDGCCVEHGAQTRTQRCFVSRCVCRGKRLDVHGNSRVEGLVAIRHRAGEFLRSCQRHCRHCRQVVGTIDQVGWTPGVGVIPSTFSGDGSEGCRLLRADGFGLCRCRGVECSSDIHGHLRVRIASVTGHSEFVDLVFNEVRCGNLSLVGIALDLVSGQPGIVHSFSSILGDEGRSGVVRDGLVLPSVGIWVLVYGDGHLIGVLAIVSCHGEEEGGGFGQRLGRHILQVGVALDLVGGRPGKSGSRRVRGVECSG